MAIIFDLSTYETTIEFLSSLIGVKEKEIINFMKLNTADYNTKHFIEKFNINLESLQLQDVEAVILHVTTNNDKNNSIKKYGLLNLQQCLTMDTPLKNYLKRKRILFDISNHIMLVNNKSIDIFFCEDEYLPHGSNKEKIHSVYNKIYKDHQITGFFCSPDPLAYLGGVSRRPEILGDINNILENELLEIEWEDNTKHYIIKFRVTLDKLQYFNFYKSKDYYIEDMLDKKKIKYELIDMALRVVWNYYYHKTLPEIYAYLKPEVIVPYENIVSIT